MSCLEVAAAQGVSFDFDHGTRWATLTFSRCWDHLILSSATKVQGYPAAVSEGFYYE